MWRSSHGPIGKAVAGWSFPCLARRRPVEFSSVILAVGLTADSDADHAIGHAASCAVSSPTGSRAAALVEQDSKAHTALGEKSKKGPLTTRWTAHGIDDTARKHPREPI